MSARRIAVGVVSSLLLVAACSGEENEPVAVPSAAGATTEAPTSSADPSTVTAQVGEQGFRAELDGVVVKAPQGVAEPGTEVTISLVEATSPDPQADIVSAVDVVLAGGQQPSEPIVITYEIAEQPGDELEFVVLRTDSGEDNYLTVGHEVVDGRVVVTTDHLSTFTLVQFNPKAWLGELVEQIELAIGLQYPKPECAVQDFGHAPDLGDYYFTAEGSGLGTVYLCAGRSPEHDLSMQFYSNGPVAWEVIADPAPTSTIPIVQLRLGDLIATAGYRLANGYPEDRVILTPGAQIAMRASEDQTPASYEGRVDELWGAVALGVEAAVGVATMGSSKNTDWLREVADLQDVTSCLTGVLSSGTDPELGPTISAGTTCLQTLLSEAGGEALLLFRLGVVSRLVLIAPQAVLSRLIAEHNNEFSVELLGMTQVAGEQLDVSEYDWVEFSSPSGGIQCVMQAGEALCQLPPGIDPGGLPPRDYCGEFFGLAGVGAGEHAGWVCSGGVLATASLLSPSTDWFDGTGWETATLDGLPTSEMAALPYGASLTMGTLLCSSDRDGVRCRRSDTGAGFKVARSGVEFYGPTQDHFW